MQKTEIKEISSEELQELFQNAVNTCLEIELAFKLMAHRLANREAFIKRVATLTDYNSELYNKITQDGTASFNMATMPHKLKKVEDETDSNN